MPSQTGYGNLTQLQRQGKITARQLETMLVKRDGKRLGKIKTHRLLNPSKLGAEWE